MANIIYNIEVTKDTLIEQGSVTKFEFPNTFKKDMTKENVHPTCGCTSFSINEDKEQITFNVKAPSFNYALSEPFKKLVTPYYKFPNGDKVEWKIEFYVKPTK
jgi:hypothetical protein